LAKRERGAVFGREADLRHRLSFGLDHEGRHVPGGERPAHAALGRGCRTGPDLAIAFPLQVNPQGRSDQGEGDDQDRGLEVAGGFFIHSGLPVARRGMTNKMWGGRFGSGPDAIMEEINASISFDQRLFAQDIKGSLAHARMLAEKGIISKSDAAEIRRGLEKVQAEIEAGTFTFS